jgi:hypothetical protein
MIKIAADCGGGCFSFHLEDKYRDRYTMIKHALINEAAYMALGHKVDLERVRAHQLKQLEAETARTEGLATSNEPTVVELTFEGDDRVFFVVTDVHTMAEEDQAAAAYLESYEGPGIPVRLDPWLTMAMFEGGASKDQVLAHLREQAECRASTHRGSRTSVIKINGGPRGSAGLVKCVLAMPDELAWARPP